MAVPVGNVMVVCPTCKLPTRIGYATQGGQGRDASRCASASATAAARRSTADGRPTEETYVPRLKQRYNDELREQLQERARPRRRSCRCRAIAKITLNMGVGEAKTDAKVLDAAMEELTIIAGQRAQMRRARKSVAQFKIREGMPIGARVTLRGDRMWEFLDRLISIALPAHPRLPRPQPGLVRRPRQLLARHPRADHLPRDRLRQHQGDPRPRRRDHDHRRDGRAGRGASARPRAAARDRSEDRETRWPRSR